MGFQSRSVGALTIAVKRRSHYQLNSYLVHAAVIQAILIVLFASFDTCLFPREVDGMLKDERTLDLFYDHMAVVHQTHISVTQGTSLELEAIDIVLRRLKAYQGNFTSFCCKEIE